MLTKQDTVLPKNTRCVDLALSWCATVCVLRHERCAASSRKDSEMFVAQRNETLLQEALGPVGHFMR